MNKSRSEYIVDYFKRSVPEHLQYDCFEDTMSLIRDGSISAQWLDENKGVNFKQVHSELCRVGKLEYNTWSGVEYIDTIIPEHFKGSLYKTFLEKVCENPVENRGFGSNRYLIKLKDVLLEAGRAEYNNTNFENQAWVNNESEVDLGGLEVVVRKVCKSDLSMTGLENKYKEVSVNPIEVEQRAVELSF